MSTDDVLQRIDDVLDEPVDDSWTRGPDAMRWAPETVDVRQHPSFRIRHLQADRPPPTPEDVQAFVDSMAAAGRGLVAAFNRLAQGIDAALKPTLDTLSRYELIPPPPPPLDTLSPRERALEAKQRRGTGPAQRRLDGRRG